MKQPHIALDDALGVEYALLPGDPARIDRILEYLDDVEPLAFNREFKSALGHYRGVKVLALSTGIGGCSAGIAVEELNNIGICAAIRIGSCGALQRGIGLGELIVVSGAVRGDGHRLRPCAQPSGCTVQTLPEGRAGVGCFSECPDIGTGTR